MISIKHGNNFTQVVYLCDVCNKEITDFGGAEALIPDGPVDSYKPPVVGHQRCTRKYEAENGFWFGNINLEEFLTSLRNNLHGITTMSSDGQMDYAPYLEEARETRNS